MESQKSKNKQESKKKISFKFLESFIDKIETILKNKGIETLDKHDSVRYVLRQYINDNQEYLPYKPLEEEE